jgi:beta-aspartyl-peptidase (threonine type)
MDACEEAIVELENDPVFDAGTGAHLNRDGNPQLDAILMDGASLQSGAVGAVERIRNPILLARRILEKGQHSFLVGPGAEQFAKEVGMPLLRPVRTCYTL